MDPRTPAIMSAIQAGIMQLMTVHEPAFLAFGYDFFMAAALLRVLLYALKTLRGHDVGDAFGGFVEVLLELALGFAMITFYEAPIPGVGLSFSNVITGSMEWFARILDAGAIDNVNTHVNLMFDKFVQPGWDIGGALMYFALLAVVALAKIASVIVLAGSMIATAVCGLLGPIFVPMFILPPLRWLFNGWLRAFITNAFVPVVALAYLTVFEFFLFQFATTLPDDITEDLYPLYLINVLVVVGAFAWEMFHVRSFTSSLMSGHGHAGAGGGGMTRMVRLFLTKGK